MKILNKILFSFGLVFLYQTELFAVPVGTTVDTRPAAPQQRKQWKEQGLSLQLGGNYFQGNVNIMNLNSSLSYNLNIDKHQFFLDGGNIFSQTGDKNLANRLNGTFLYAYNLLDNFNFYYYMSHSHDPSIKLDYRLTNGAGICLHKIANNIFSVLLVSAGVSTENEWFQNNNNFFAPRSVIRVSGTLPINNTFELGFDTFHTQSFYNLSDFRIYGEAYINIKIIEEYLNLKISLADEYDSMPLKDIKNNDLGLFMNLNINFGK